jgi:GNAT superfamily N-acetyltransferase
MLKQRGFDEKFRVEASRLDLTVFDMSPFGNIWDSIRQKGIDIKTLEELTPDPERDRKLYDLQWELLHDVPGCENARPIDFQAFVRDELGPHMLSPGNYHIALHGSTYIGVCVLNPVPSETTIRLNMTGVRREYRRQKVALALKLQAIASARDNGFQYMTTRNESANTAILKINARLGFERKADWIQFARARS